MDRGLREAKQALGLLGRASGDLEGSLGVTHRDRSMMVMRKLREHGLKRVDMQSLEALRCGAMMTRPSACGESFIGRLLEQRVTKVIGGGAFLVLFEQPGSNRLVAEIEGTGAFYAGHLCERAEGELAPEDRPGRE